MLKPPLFDTVSTAIDFPENERRILAFWKEKGIFEKTLQARRDAPIWSFYEGPPTANGLPHNGHVLTRVIKDLFPRYMTMRGYQVPRKAGWDTHGLAVEVEVEKELRIHGKAAIERFGIEPFISRCIESVFRYISEWKRLTERIGFWVDLDGAYVTYHRSYIESVWWALAELFRKGLLYQGHKVVWWWAQGGTALSSAEVGMGYKTVDDPSAFVAFPLSDRPDDALLIWTTTPWTLPSNMYVAVNPTVEYVTVDPGDRKLIVAAARKAAVEKTLGRPLPVIATCSGAQLVGLRYRPPFDVYEKRLGETKVAVAGDGEEYAYWRVVASSFVTLSDGTGLVHVAPAFGEEDYEVFRREAQRLAHPESLQLLCAVNPDGTFSTDIPALSSMFVKAADRPILKDLKDRGLLVHAETYRHEYPFCWRADEDPLIQFARPAWYIRTTSRVAEAIAHNKAIHWVPEHIRDGRFGNFLENNVDWALSRERFWGTPLPLWVSSVSGEVEAISSLEELRKKPGNNLADVEEELARFVSSHHQEMGARAAHHLIVHRPWIDKVRYSKPGSAGEFNRVPEVIDAWFDSGSMPFAQWGFPHLPGSKEPFDRSFPADFISEAIDQTRGWFYSLLMVNTMVFDPETLTRFGLKPRKPPVPYKTCLVLGHVCDKTGKKESKSKGNYTPPEIVLDRVQMDFAVASGEDGRASIEVGEALIAFEDLEGLDVSDGARIWVYCPDKPDLGRELILRGNRKLRRRVALLHPVDRNAIGARPSSKAGDVLPSEVQRLPAAERIVIEDRSVSAPGADAFRWFFFASSPSWSNVRHSLGNVRLLQKEFQIKLRNIYSFLTIYANIDGFSPAPGNESSAKPVWKAIERSRGYTEVRSRSLLDRWILSEVQLVARAVAKALDSFQVYEAAQALVAVVDALSNWYLRRSRSRFWAPGLEQDKVDGYFTLYEALLSIVGLAAPFIPFFAEDVYQNLVCRAWGASQPESIHLCPYPEPKQRLIDEALSLEMQLVRELASLGLRVRTDAKLKVRQPLKSAEIILARQDLTQRVSGYRNLIADELNVAEVHFHSSGYEGLGYRIRLNLPLVGRRLGPMLPRVREALASADARSLVRQLEEEQRVVLQVDGKEHVFGREEVEVFAEAPSGFAAASSSVGVVILKTELTEELIDEGLVRELLAHIQAARRQLALGYEERIILAIDGTDRIRRVIHERSELISRETLATELTVGPPAFSPELTEDVDVNGHAAKLALARCP